MDKNAVHSVRGWMTTNLPQNKVVMGEGEWAKEGEWETRGGMEEGLPDPSSSAVTNCSDPALTPESARC